MMNNLFEKMGKIFVVQQNGNDLERQPLLVKSLREKKNRRFVVFVVIYFMFLASSAAMFSYLETPEELAVKMRVNTALQKFLAAHPTVTNTDLEELIKEIVEANNRGVSAIGNVTGPPNWSFGQSIFFATTVVTTIGYGHVTPLSKAGKAFCILYAAIGLPLTVVLMSAIVERLMVPTVWLLKWLNSKLGHLFQPLNIRLFHLLIMGILLVVFFILIPAVIFSSIEPDWDYLDSVYYCFISLTSIGLGDYIPGDSADQSYRPVYKIATTCYLFVGVAFTMLTVAVFYDIPQLNLGLLFTTDSDDGTGSEKLRLATSAQSLQYGIDDHRQVVRVRSRRADSPSPDENGPKTVP